MGMYLNQPMSVGRVNFLGLEVELALIIVMSRSIVIEKIAGQLIVYCLEPPADAKGMSNAC